VFYNAMLRLRPNRVNLVAFMGCGDHALPAGLNALGRQPTMTRIRVIVGRRFSFKKNITGEKNGV
jgi:hypothetical protein